jgi:hypothetical protein
VLARINFNAVLEMTVAAEARPHKYKALIITSDVAPTAARRWSALVFADAFVVRSAPGTTL